MASSGKPNSKSTPVSAVLDKKNQRVAVKFRDHVSVYNYSLRRFKHDYPNYKLVDKKTLNLRNSPSTTTADPPLISGTPTISTVPIDIDALSQDLKGDPVALTSKDKIYQAWAKDPTLTVNSLLELVDYAVAPTTVSKWISAWKRGNKIPQQSAAQLIKDLKQQTTGTADPAEIRRLEEMLEKLKKELVDTELAAKTKENDLTTKLKDAEKRRPKTIILKSPDGKTKRIKTIRHPAYEDVITLASLRKNVFLPGPAGCGKSHLTEQVANDLGLDYSFINCSAGMSEGHLVGRLLPVGASGKFEYVISEYVLRYEKGGLFCADEIDGADPNVLLVINTSIANDYMTLNNRPKSPRIKRHKDFVFVACANTFGRGNDRLYVGRNQLDEATLDRFRIGTVPMDYDDGIARKSTEIETPKIPEWFKKDMSGKDTLETALCPDDDLRVRMQWYRRMIEINRLERIVSTRFMKDAYEMKEKAKWDDQKIDKALFSGWPTDEIQLVQNENSTKSY